MNRNQIKITVICECGHKMDDHSADEMADGRTGCVKAVGIVRCECTKIPEPKYDVQYHAQAVSADGAYLPDVIWGWEMPVLADCTTIEDAREWAAGVFASDQRVARVTINELLRERAFRPGGWWHGRHIETIARPIACEGCGAESGQPCNPDCLSYVSHESREG